MKEQQGVLFSAEEMNSIEKSNLWNQQQGPVKCLGMEFENDEERRAYFREELRKKLPELRKIEGFPIGEDDDIINLSDPPYYTACPNPWLNDFIAEWEKEKVQLEREGKRKADFDVKEPYASDVSEGKNNPVYNAHTYHTKVPHPAIMRYILHYTQPGDIVYDGFAGTGMVGVAASHCGNPEPSLKQKISAESKNQLQWGLRHAICGDLSPFASFISYIYNTPISPKLFEIEANKIIDEVEEELGWMYETRHTNGNKGIISFVVWSDVFLCPSCGKEIVYYNEGVNDEEKTINESFPCPHCGITLSKKNLQRCKETIYDNAIKKTIVHTKSVPVLIKYRTSDGKRYEKKPDDFDLELIKRISKMEIPYWYPTNKMMNKDGRWGEQWRTFHEGLNNVHHFFTHRNLYIASAIYQKTIGRGVLNSMMTSYLSNIGSKMARYKMGKSGNVNMPGTLYVASATAEQNIFQGYRGKISDLAKAYSRNNSGLVNVASASNSLIADNSIDYIFTDPPFGDNIMYSELNFIQESWLKVQTHNTEEAIISNFYHKGLNEYYTLMFHCFRDYYRVLKPGKWITIEFSNTRASVWNAIQRALQNAGFIVANVSSIDKKQASYNAVTSTTAVKQDLVLSCYKPSINFLEKIASMNGSKENVWDFVTEHLVHLPIHIERGNATTTVIERSPKILYDRLISYYVQHGYQIPMDAQEFQAGLRERFIERDGMYFTAPQAAEYEEKRKHTSEFVPMGLIVSDEANGIEWLKLQLKEPKTYQEISPEWMQAVKGLRKGDVLPELKDILEENFIEDETGHWHVPDLEKQIDLEKLKHKSLMKEFNLYKEMAQKPRARIKEVRVEALREGFKQCFKDKDFTTILLVGDKIPQNILTEDEQLLQYYDIAQMRA